LFIGLLAFVDPAAQDAVKIGVLAGSVLSGVAGYAVLRFARSDPKALPAAALSRARREGLA
jgi:NhaA family Na+:H+ antiporter